MNTLKFCEKELQIDDKIFDFNFKIRDARIIDNKAIVIFETDYALPQRSQFQNCYAFNDDCDLLWIAEHPTTEIADVYIEFMSITSNKIWNFSCYIVEIDFETGKIIDVEFTK